MFERFTHEAKQVVLNAQQEARRLRHSWLGTEHILLGLLCDPESRAAATLRRYGIDRSRAESEIMRIVPTSDLDAEALEVIGIDIDAVREKVEAAFGPGALDHPRAPSGRGTRHVPFCRRARKSLELSLREAVRLRHKHIGAEHILLGLLREGNGLACRVLVDSGVDLAALRTDVEVALHG